MRPTYKLFLGCLFLSLVSPWIASLGAAEPAVVRIWDHHIHDKKFRQNAFKAFNKANPEIKIEYTGQIADAYTTVLDAAFRSGNPPDLFFGIGNVYKLIETKDIIPIDDLASSKKALADWVATFPQGLLPFVESINTFDGRIYSWPTVGEGGRMLLFWNTKLFREAGLKAADGSSAVPETWADMRTFAKKITEVGQGKVYGIVHGIKSPDVWIQDIAYSLAVSAGWSIGYGMSSGYDLRTGRYDFHSRSLTDPIRLWLDMKKDGSIFPGDLSMDDEQAKFRFSQDLAGMIFGGPWVPGGLLAVNDSLEFDVVLPPVEKRGERKGYISVGPLARTSEYVVSSKTKAKEAVWKVIQFMTSKEFQEGWVQAGGGISVFPEYNKPEFFPHPTMGKIAAMSTTGRRTAPEMPAVINKLWEIWEPVHPDWYETMSGLWVGAVGWDAFDEVERKTNASLDKGLAELRKMGYKITLADITFPDWDPAENYARSAASSR